MTAPKHVCLMTINDVCTMLSVSESTIRRLAENRAIPFLKVGGSVRFRLTDVNEYLDKQTVRTINA